MDQRAPQHTFPLQLQNYQCSYFQNLPQNNSFQESSNWLFEDLKKWFTHSYSQNLSWEKEDSSIPTTEPLLSLPGLKTTSTVTLQEHGFLQIPLLPRDLDQCWSTELSSMMKMFCNHPQQYVATEHLKCASVTKQLNFKFCLVNLNLIETVTCGYWLPYWTGKI